MFYYIVIVLCPYPSKLKQPWSRCLFVFVYSSITCFDSLNYPKKYQKKKKRKMSTGANHGENETRKNLLFRRRWNQTKQHGIYNTTFSSHVSFSHKTLGFRYRIHRNKWPLSLHTNQLSSTQHFLYFLYSILLTTLTTLQNSHFCVGNMFQNFPFLLFLFFGLVNGRWQHEEVVVSVPTIHVDHSGLTTKFRTIQSAIDSIPSNNHHWIRISIKPGIYKYVFLL